MIREYSDLKVGDVIDLLGRPCTVISGPCDAGGRSVDLTVELPGGAPQRLVEHRSHRVRVDPRT